MPQTIRALRKVLGYSASDESGQAMVEYSLFTFFVVIAVGTGILGFLPAAFRAYETYVKGYYVVLNLPVP